MKLTKNHKDLVKVNEEFICPNILAINCGLSDFLKTDDGELYKFSTLCHAQLTTQVLLYKMMQELSEIDDSESNGGLFDNDWHIASIRYNRNKTQ